MAGNRELSTRKAREQESFDEIVNDFELYAAINLKIKNKLGKILPLVFNEPQRYIHAQIENQLAKTGRVRALILKGRQQGACLSPDMKVLKSDFSWIDIDNVKVGDKLLSVDEGTSERKNNGFSDSRKMRTAIVEEKHEFEKEIFEITLDNGTILKSTKDHRWMTRQRGGCYVLWRELKDLKVGDVLRAATHKPDKIKRTFEDGWIGGILDADGSCSTTGSPRIAFSQVDGNVLDRYKKYLNKHNIKFYETIDSRTKVGRYTKLGDKPVHCVRVDRFPDMVKLISRCSPVRFDREGMYLGRKLSTSSNGFDAWSKILSIKSLGLSRVIDIQTSTKTFIAEGIVSHNSTYTEARYYYKTTTKFGQQAFILTHEIKATNNLFAMAKRFHDNSSRRFKPSVGASNEKELFFDKIDSGYKVGTAGSRAVGRSGTIQYFHGSEVAFWGNADEHVAGVMECVPDGEYADGTEILLESTANGIGGKFYDMWVSAVNGKSDYIAIFVPWFWSKEYRMKVPNGFVLTPEEQRKKEIYGVTDEQICWRRDKEIKLGKDLCNQEYPYCWEDAFLATGRTVFEKDAVALAAKECFSPMQCMVLENETFVKRDDGELKVWELPDPNRRYVIGADVAEGLIEGDFSSSDVLDEETGYQVAQFHGHIAPDTYGNYLNLLGRFYNTALVGVENNNHGLTTNITLRDLGYPNLYVQKEIDNAYSGDREQRRIGWMTTKKSKPYIIDLLSADLRSGDSGIVCIDTINECRTYIVHPNGSFGAQVGCFDDRVMSIAIAKEMQRQSPNFKKE